MKKEKDFFLRIREAFTLYKREICLFLLFCAIVVDILPSELVGATFGDVAASKIQLSALLIVSLLAIDVLFEIFFDLKENNKRVTRIESSAILDNIFRLIEREGQITINYIAIAGATGWGSVLSKLVDANDSHSLLDKREVNINICLIDEPVLDTLEASKERYEAVSNIVNEINRAKKRLDDKNYKNIKISLHRYNHMPNIMGFLVNGNYLFSTFCYWEEEDGMADSYVLRGGRRNHIVYDKNDGFGGDFYIEKFEGWFKYITRKK
ncbi:MAG: hypothetical protein ACRBCI_07190 [Cellvibrionaceae bacterium]